MDTLFLILAFALSYWKTGELLANFAPQQMFGINDPAIAYLYGYASAALVELFAWHRYRQMKQASGDNRMAHFAFGMIGVAVAILANALDTVVINNELATLPPLMSNLVRWGVPALPALFLALHYTAAMFDKMPQTQGGKSLSDTFTALVAQGKQRIEGMAGGGKASAKKTVIVVPQNDPKAQAPNSDNRG